MVDAGQSKSVFCKDIPTFSYSDRFMGFMVKKNMTNVNHVNVKVCEIGA